MRSVLRGFTLIELLIVIAILGILSTIAMSSFKNAQIRSRDTQRKSDLQQISKALELFYNDYERYPTASTGNIAACPYNSDTGNGVECSDSDLRFRDDKGSTYFRVLPEDPSGFSYFYRTTMSNQAYQLYAHLENSEDADCLDGNCTSPTLPSGPEPNCGSEICNFAVTSSNVSATD